MSRSTGRRRASAIWGSGDCAPTIVYALVDADDPALFPEPVYVGRTRRPLPARLSSHRTARNAEWLKTSNAELAEWLESTVAAAIVLDEVPDGGDEWAAEKAWIRKYSATVVNKVGNPAWTPKRCGGRLTPVAAA